MNFKNTEIFEWIISMFLLLLLIYLENRGYEISHRLNFKVISNIGWYDTVRVRVYGTKQKQIIISLPTQHPRNLCLVQQKIFYLLQYQESSAWVVCRQSYGIFCLFHRHWYDCNYSRRGVLQIYCCEQFLNFAEFSDIFGYFFNFLE